MPWSAMALILYGISHVTHNPREKAILWKRSLQSTKSGGRRALFVAELQGKGSRKGSVFFTDTGMSNAFILDASDIG